MCVNIFIYVLYIYICFYIFTYAYMHTYIFRERENENGGVYIYSIASLTSFYILLKLFNCKFPEESDYIFTPLYLTKNLVHTMYVLNIQ